MAATTSIHHLSASAGGKQIKVGATGTPGTLIHQTGISADVIDEPRILVNNSHTAAVLLTLEWGGVTSPDDLVQVSIPAQAGDFQVAIGKTLSGDGAAARNIRAFAGTTNVLKISGHVLRRTP
jgi:hypothetical protein